MMITLNTKSYISKEDVKFMAHLTAATVAQVFQYLIQPHPEVDKLYYFNSYQKWHNKRDKEDALAELCSYLAGWEHDVLLKEFNSPSFNFWLVHYFKSHLKTKGFFYQKYTDRGKQDFSLEIDAPEVDFSPIYKEYDLSIHSLSIFQFVKIITHLLNTERAKKLFERKDVDFFLKFYIQPIADNGKKVKITEVAKEHNMEYSLLVKRIKTIKRYLKSCIQNQYDVSFIYNK